MNRKHSRIAYLIDDLSYGGAQNLLALLAEALPESFIPLIFCLSESSHPLGELLKRKGIDVFTFRRRSHFDLQRFAAVIRKLAKNRIDIIHGFLNASNAYTFLAGRILKKPVVLTLFSNQFFLKGLRASILKTMYRRADGVMVNSKAGKALLINSAGVPEEKVRLIRNWFPEDRFPSLHSENTNRDTKKEEIIGYLGRLSKIKSLDILIQAFLEVSRNRPQARLVLIGQGEEMEALDSLSRRLNLEDKVSFPGPVNDLFGTLRSFSCFVLPSANEGLPNVVIEALAAGIPVVASSVGDVSDLIENERTGILLERTTPETLADGILRALSHPSLSETARREGPAFVRANFSMEAGMEKVLAMYEEILEQSSR